MAAYWEWLEEIEQSKTLQEFIEAGSGNVTLMDLGAVNVTGNFTAKGVSLGDLPFPPDQVLPPGQTYTAPTVTRSYTGIVTRYSAKRKEGTTRYDVALTLRIASLS